MTDTSTLILIARSLQASTAGAAGVVQTLVSHGVDVQACNHIGETALMRASVHSDPAIVEELISVGARLDAADRELGFTALMYAASQVRAEGSGEGSRGGRLEARSAREWEEDLCVCGEGYVAGPKNNPIITRKPAQSRKCKTSARGGSSNRNKDRAGRAKYVRVGE